METIQNILSAVDSFVWGPVMLVLLVGTGIFLTIRTRFLPIRLFPEMLRVTAEKHIGSRNDAISGLQALIVSTATRVGMGNMIGVVAAISAGGAGAARPRPPPPAPSSRKREGS